MTSPTRKDLQRWAEIAERATPGDWHAADCISPQVVLYAVPAQHNRLNPDDVLYLGRVYCDARGQGRNNLQFIAAARQAVPRLVAEVTRLRALCREACAISNEALTEYSGHIDDNDPDLTARGARLQAITAALGDNE